jgi:hypothetical protein
MYQFNMEAARQEHFGLDTPGGGYILRGEQDPTDPIANQAWKDSYQSEYNPRNFRRGGLAALRYG